MIIVMRTIARKMKFVPITADNVAMACRMQHQLFPQEDCNADHDYVNGYTHPERRREHWLIQVGSDFVGIAGIYDLDVEPETAWLGWFGIMPEFRRKGYGEAALSLFEDVARKRGYLYARLFTERTDADAIRLYLRCGFSQEEYSCPTDPDSLTVPMYIMSKSLYMDRPCPAWNNRDIKLWYQFSKQTERLYE